MLPISSPFNTPLLRGPFRAHRTSARTKAPGGMIYAAVRAVVLLCVIGSSPAAAFQAGLSGRPAIAQRASAVVLAETVMDPTPGAVAEDCGCAEESGGVLMNDVRVTGRTLRNTVLADVNGGRSSVGEVIGDEGKAVVIFLRHLG